VGRQSQEPIAEEEVNILIAIGEMVGNTIQRMELHEQTVQDAKEISSAYDLTLLGWAKALELRDRETEGHSRRVEDLALSLARHLGIPDDELEHFRRGVLLHDIGKMGIHDQLLRKSEPLTEADWTELQKHPQYAYDMLYPITYLRPALDIPYCHHEKWDGSGYPQGLKGEEIPLTARIFAVVDVWDALRSDRPYRSAWTDEEALAYIKENAGSHFDPQVVEAFLQLLALEG
jgi:HD-GYP domain-containing protein (c-di-GMP phosphodiesterase class II)